MGLGCDSSSDDSDFSELVLKFIGQILMEEDIEDKPSMFYDPLGLQVTEKSFCDALGQKYRPPPTQCQQTDWVGDHACSQPNWQPNNGSQVLANPSNGATNIGDVQELLSRNIFTDAESVLQFRRGIEEASKFLPMCNQLAIESKRSVVSTEWKEKDHKEESGERETSASASRGRKNHGRETIDAEEVRSNKFSAIRVEGNELPEMFDKVLLCTDAPSVLCGKDGPLQNEANKASLANGQPQGANGKKSRAKKQGKKEEAVDLSTELILCAQAVSAGDYRTANELLKQIRQHSTPVGDASQRLAYYFANGLEARLAGTGIGTQIFYASLVSNRISTSEILKAFKIHLSACPFRRILLFFANRMIYKVAEKATCLHIIDFGIQYGFHWPLLIQQLSKRPGGPPKLRITGIEVPRSGFRPTERIEETGRRLTEYCERFNVPFEFHAIASKNWETIEIGRLMIDRSEFLAVNCALRLKNVLDETVEGTSPRSAVLDLIRRTNPNIFVHSIVNGAYDAAFFVTRFREALFHFSALYDIFDVTISRDNQERLMFEREFYGREAMNVIACEGLERVERPETYKQWQVRTMRAGFRQLPLDQQTLNLFKSRMKEWYHKDFVLEDDNRWMLQGWKGRIVYASSCWVPA